MTTPGLVPRCSVYIDGVRAADGQPNESDDQPVVLDDLVVVWGRNNTLDQPNPASCTFRILDVPGGLRFLSMIRIGSRVRVQADATIYPDPSVSTIPTLIPGPIVNGTATGSGTTSNTLLATSTRGDALTVTYPPRAYSTNPSAWDAVPRAAAGQAWHVTVAVTLPAVVLGWRNYAAEIRPVAFTAPNSASAVVLPDVQKLTAPASGDAVFDLSFVPPEGAWIGLQVRIYPVGPRWQDLVGAWTAFGAVTWNSLDTFVVRSLLMSAPAAGALRSGAVFDGRCTDLEAAYDEGVGGTVVNVIAQDDTAELGNRYVGAAPYPLETVATRFGKIVADSGQPIAYSVDAGVGGLQVSYQDVDSRPAADLLQLLARSVAGVLWNATSLTTGPFLRLEDISSRPALLKLTADTAVNRMVKPSFQDGSVADFVGTACTVAAASWATPANPNAGTKGLRVTSTAAANFKVETGNPVKVPVTPGRVYRASAYVRGVTTPSTANGRLDIDFRDANNATIAGSSVLSPSIPLINGWQRKEVTSIVAPANAVTMHLILWVHGTVSVVGYQADWDAIMVHEVAAVTDATLPYFDGDTPPDATFAYSWDGARWASASRRVGLATIVPTPPAGSVNLDACSVLLEPVRWQQTTEDDSTRVVLTWREQTTNVNPPPAVVPTDRDETVTDDVREAATGRRRVGITTILSQQATANAVANLYLARLQTPGWRISGLVIDLAYETLDPVMLANVMQILDGATRIGLPILLTNLPTWTPVADPDQSDQALYLEGGRFVNQAGRWRLELLVSNAAAQGKSQVRWIDLPVGMPWTGFGSLTWNDLIGVGI